MRLQHVLSLGLAILGLLSLITPGLATPDSKCMGFYEPCPPCATESNTIGCSAYTTGQGGSNLPCCKSVYPGSNQCIWMMCDWQHRECHEFCQSPFGGSMDVITSSCDGTWNCSPNGQNNPCDCAND
jgi:hypothetical protein